LREAMERTPKARRDLMDKTTRTEVTNAAACPTCGAEPREPCRGVERRDGRRRHRKRLHAERWKAAEVDTRAERERRDLEAMARLSLSE
jgi:hypothetical protein